MLIERGILNASSPIGSQENLIPNPQDKLPQIPPSSQIKSTQPTKENIPSLQINTDDDQYTSSKYVSSSSSDEESESSSQVGESIIPTIPIDAHINPFPTKDSSEGSDKDEHASSKHNSDGNSIDNEQEHNNLPTLNQNNPTLTTKKVESDSTLNKHSSSSDEHSNSITQDTSDSVGVTNSVPANFSSNVTSSTTLKNDTYEDSSNDMLDDSGKDHEHDEDEDDEIFGQDTKLNSTSKPDTNSEDFEHRPDQPPMDILDPVEAEKLKKKERENAERTILEKKVRKEYRDELSGMKSNITSNSSDPTSLTLPKPLLFLHIPKTAGSTLAQIFRNNEQPTKYLHLWNHPRLKDLPSIPNKTTIFGHFRYGLHFYLPNQTASYATFLRDPVERVISYYYFHLQDQKDQAHQFAKEHPFEEWLDLYEGAQNEMTKSLSGIRSEFLPSNESFNMAKHHLNAMGFVGLTERFDDSLTLMKYYLGFKDISYGSTKVGIKKPKTITDDVREKIKQKNLMDIELYEIAKVRFEEQMEELKQYLLQKELGH